MFRRFLTAFAVMAAAIFVLNMPSALASPEIGKPAPDFKAVDIHGKEISLADLKGQVTVLEWSNHGCPFVKKHYGAGNMQATQKAAIDKGVNWITIISSAPGRQGHVTPQEAQQLADDRGAVPTTQILDEDGSIGHLYGAQTTPHMYIIDQEGTLVYKGAIDSIPSPNPATIKDATNYVLAALDSLSAGEEIAVSSTRAYGCSIKYAH